MRASQCIRRLGSSRIEVPVLSRGLALTAAATKMQQIDVMPLSKPSLSRVRSEPSFEFATEDPDCTATKYHRESPSFFEAVNPIARAHQTTVEEIDVSRVNGFVPGYSFARAVGGVLQETECTEVLRWLHGKRFTPALGNSVSGVQRYLPRHRNGGGYRVLRCDRVPGIHLEDSPLLADWLLEVLRPHLPQTIAGEQSQWRVPKALVLSEINERCRFLCYSPGQQFKPHTDGGEMRRSRALPSSPSARNLSLVTVQLYLHDMPSEHGGVTQFIESERHCDNRAHVAGHQPRAGSALLFTQELAHEGAAVHAGRKFMMRSEVMYAGYQVPC